LNILGSARAQRAESPFLPIPRDHNCKLTLFGDSDCSFSEEISSLEDQGCVTPYTLLSQIKGYKWLCGPN
jgi:hypothetical protein